MLTRSSSLYLTSALVGDEWSTARSGYLEKDPVPILRGG